MGRYLALDADSSLVQLLSASGKGDSLRLERLLTWEEGNPVSLANAEEIGGRLREQLKQSGVAPAPLLVSIGRDRVILKEIKVPAVAEHEEPALVRFQALKEFADSGEEVVLDYVPLGPPGPDGRRIQVISVRKDLVRSYRKLAEVAGLKLAAITPRPFALLAGLMQAIRNGQVPQPQPAGAPVGLLVRGQKWGEFLIVRNGTMVLSRSIAGPALGSDAALLGEIRRNLALHANQNADNPVRALYLAEPDTPGGLRERLQTSLAIPVYAYEPVAGVPVPDGPPGALAGLAGLFALQGSREPSINFVHPREPKPPADPNRRVLLWGSVAAVVLLALFGIFSYVQVAAKSREVARLQQQQTQAEDLVKAIDPDVKRLKALEEWTATDVNWLDEIYDLTDRMRDTKNVRLTSIVVTPLEDRTPPKPGAKKETPQNPKVATLTLHGLTSSNQALERFIAELQVERPAYQVGTKEIKQNRAMDRNLFSWEFSVKVTVSRREPNQYTRALKVAAPPKRGDDDAADANEGGRP